MKILENIKYILLSYVIILSASFTAATLFCSVFYNKESFGINIFWEIITISIFCTISMFVVYSKYELSKKQMLKRYIFHFFTILAILLTSGYFFNWINFSKSIEIIIFILLSAGAYGFVFFTKNLIDEKMAKKINQKINMLNKNTKKQ